MFIKPISRDGFASSCNTDCINIWVTTFCGKIDNFIQTNHTNEYPNWKRGTTYASSGTTFPPPL